MEYFKRMWSVILGLIATLCNAYGVIFILVCVAIVFDVVTGIVASKANGIVISSKRAHQGFWKKVGLILALFFGVFLDTFIPILLGMIDITLPFNMPFGLVFGCYIVLNESISICENIYKINPTILPKWVISLLTGGKNKIDDLLDNMNKDDE